MGGQVPCSARPARLTLSAEKRTTALPADSRINPPAIFFKSPNKTNCATSTRQGHRHLIALARGISCSFSGTRIAYLLPVRTGPGAMNGVASPFGQPPQVWQEHRTADGRPYFYNTITRVTQWTKPEELLTPAEVSDPFRCAETVTGAGN